MKSFRAYIPGVALAAMVAAGCATDPQNRRAGEVFDDASITTRVKTALIKEDDVKARNINVNTYRGVVQLNGFVESQAAADRAVAEARRVPGVARVENNLTVRPLR